MKTSGGLIKLLLLILAAVLILSYFRVDLRQIVESEAARRNFGYLWGILRQGWEFVTQFLTNLR